MKYLVLDEEYLNEGLGRTINKTVSSIQGKRLAKKWNAATDTSDFDSSTRLGGNSHRRENVWDRREEGQYGDVAQTDNEGKQTRGQKKAAKAHEKDINKAIRQVGGDLTKENRRGEIVSTRAGRRQQSAEEKERARQDSQYSEKGLRQAAAQKTKEAKAARNRQEQQNKKTTNSARVGDNLRTVDGIVHNITREEEEAKKKGKRVTRESANIFDVSFI